MLAGHHEATEATVTPHLSWTGETKCSERLLGWDKDEERSLTTYCHGQNRLCLGKLVSLITN